MINPITIAVDFDGTIVEHEYPKIGKERPFAIHTLKALQAKGHHLILWTYRAGKELEEAITFCREKNFEFYAINKNYPEEKFNETKSRKILADIYIDDRSIGGLPSWYEIFQMLHPEDTSGLDLYAQKKKKWWRW